VIAIFWRKSQSDRHATSTGHFEQVQIGVCVKHEASREVQDIFISHRAERLTFSRYRNNPIIHGLSAVLLEKANGHMQSVSKFLDSDREQYTSPADYGEIWYL
jgi:uncharacterized lipoprotein